MYFCIRDDDTSFFTSPEDLERVYGEITQWGPVSLAVVPFHRAGTSKAVPARFRGRWTIHPLHENRELVEYLRSNTANGRFEIMLHGYYHDDRRGSPEFTAGSDLGTRVSEGRKYLEDLLGVAVRVFVPPHNRICRRGLQAVARSKLHLGGVAGFRAGWSPLSYKAWSVWLYIRRWHKTGGIGIPWVLDLGDHRELAGNAITPSSDFRRNQEAFELALKIGGVFCAATHYWEMSAASVHRGGPKVGEQLTELINRARSDSRIVWRSIGDLLSECAAKI